MSGVTTLIFVGAVMFAVLGGVTLLSHIYNLNIKAKTVGNGQHGTARWANIQAYTVHTDKMAQSGKRKYNTDRYSICTKKAQP